MYVILDDARHQPRALGKTFLQNLYYTPNKQKRKSCAFFGYSKKV
jgi:hypothetical protein